MPECMTKALCVTDADMTTSEAIAWHEDIASTPRALPQSSPRRRAGRSDLRAQPSGIREASVPGESRVRGRDWWLSEAPFHRALSSKSQWECCQQEKLQQLPANAPRPSTLVSESFLATRFDEEETFDEERSHERYSKVSMHTGQKSQRRSGIWEDWVGGAVAGQTVLLLEGLRGSGSKAWEKPLQCGVDVKPACSKVSAMYCLDRDLTRLCIVPMGPEKVPAISVPVQNLQMICPASDFMPFFGSLNSQLDESEKARAVLLQYVTEHTEQKFVCMLEESDLARDRFVQALTALWQEQRSDRAMQF